MQNVTSADGIFNNLQSLKYINLDNVKNAGDIIRESYLNNLDNLVVI